MKSALTTTLLLLAFCLATEAAHAQKFDDLAPTPPMGWNSWNKFGCNVDEQLIRETAEAMVASGMKEAGLDTTVPGHEGLMVRLARVAGNVGDTGRTH